MARIGLEVRYRSYANIILCQSTTRLFGEKNQHLVSCTTRIGEANEANMQATSIVNDRAIGFKLNQ